MTDQDQAEFLDELARAVRLAHDRLDAIGRGDLEALLGLGGALHTGIGPIRSGAGVPEGLTGQVNQSGPSFSLGNVDQFPGETNVLLDPTWENVSTTTVPTGSGITRLSSQWSCHHVLNSGALPANHQLWRSRGRDRFNAAVVAIELGDPALAAVAAYDIDVYLYPTNAFDPAGLHRHDPLPYLVAAVGEQRYNLADLGSATLSITVQIVDGAGSVVAESLALDPNTTDFWAVNRMDVATQQTPSAFWATTWRWRLRVHAVNPSSGVTFARLSFFQPQMHFAFSPDPTPYTPVLASWSPRELIAEVDSSDRPIVFREPATDFRRFSATWNGHLWWGGGAAVEDVSLWRSGTKELLLEDGSLGPVAFRLIGRRVATPKATQTLAAGTAIVADYEVVQISSAGAITSTATPTIADGSDGQMLMLLNVGGDNIKLQDQATLGGSNLRLTAAGVTMTPRDSIKLMYSSTIADWVQVGPLVGVL